MPVLVTELKAEFSENIESQVYLFGNINTAISIGDFIEIGKLYAFLQDFSKVDSINILMKPLIFGLKNGYNTNEVNLEISY